METKRAETSQWNRLIAGGFTGAVVRTIVQPFDVLKIRFQLQIEPITMSSTVSKYKSLPQCVYEMVKEEGLTSLWKGHVAAQLLSITYTSVQFSSFNLIHKSLEQLINGVQDDHGHTTSSGKHASSESSKKSPRNIDISTLNYLISGSLSGMTAAVVSHPFDTIRTRLVGQGEPKIYQSMSQAVVKMVKYEGSKSLFKGLKPNLLLVAPQAGLTFSSYKFFKDVWTSLWPSGHSQGSPEVFKNLACGASSGIFAKTLVYPFDSIKKRLQVEGFDSARMKFTKIQKYNSSALTCLIKIVNQEGFFGLFKGYQATLLKSTISTAINFALYEYLIVNGL